MGNPITQNHFLEIKGRQLITAEILYFLPDYPDLLQTFIWQNLDFPPNFPRLQSFLTFWEKNIEGRLYRVQVAQGGSIGNPDPRFAQAEFSFH